MLFKNKEKKPKTIQLFREVVTAPNLSEYKKHLDNALGHGVILGVTCAGPGAGLNDHNGSLPTQFIL